jgi:hypothetical protein
MLNAISVEEKPQKYLGQKYRSFVTSVFAVSLAWGCPLPCAAVLSEKDGYELPFAPIPLDEDEKAWRDLLNQLWRTPLGEMYREFLFSKVEKKQLPLRTKYFVDEIFSQRHKLLIRISALQLMTKDLYARGLMDLERQRRILILEGDVSARRISVGPAEGKELGYQAAMVLLACLPYGSPLVRAKVSIFLERVRGLLFRAPPRLAGMVIPEHSLLSWHVLSGYDFGNSLVAFMNVFGPYSTVHFLFNEWYGAVREDVIEDNALLLGLDDFIREQNL